MAVSIRKESGWILDAGAKETRAELAKLKALRDRVNDSLTVSQETLNYLHECGHTEKVK